MTMPVNRYLEMFAISGSTSANIGINIKIIMAGVIVFDYIHSLVFFSRLYAYWTKAIVNTLTKKIIKTSSIRKPTLSFGMIICVQAKAIIIKIEILAINQYE